MSKREVTADLVAIANARTDVDIQWLAPPGEPASPVRE